MLTQLGNNIKHLGYCVCGSIIYNKSKSLLRFELSVTPLKPQISMTCYADKSNLEYLE